MAAIGLREEVRDYLADCYCELASVALPIWKPVYGGFNGNQGRQGEIVAEVLVPDALDSSAPSCCRSTW